MAELGPVLRKYIHCTHTRACTHTHTQAKPIPVECPVNQYCDAHAPLRSQAIQPCAGKFSWDRASNPQEDCPGLMDRGRRAYSSTTTLAPLSETKTVGHLLPQFTPGIH